MEVPFEVIQHVEVTREVPIEVSREVERMKELVREVPIEVVREKVRNDLQIARGFLARLFLTGAF